MGSYRQFFLVVCRTSGPKIGFAESEIMMRSHVPNGRLNRPSGPVRLECLKFRYKIKYYPEKSRRKTPRPMAKLPVRLWERARSKIRAFDGLRVVSLRLQAQADACPSGQTAGRSRTTRGGGEGDEQLPPLLNPLPQGRGKDT